MTLAPAALTLGAGTAGRGRGRAVGLHRAHNGHQRVAGEARLDKEREGVGAHRQARLHSSGVLSLLLVLQEGQAVVRLSKSELPPRERGMTWSQ